MTSILYLQLNLTQSTKERNCFLQSRILSRIHTDLSYNKHIFYLILYDGKRSVG